MTKCWLVQERMGGEELPSKSALAIMASNIFSYTGGKCLTKPPLIKYYMAHKLVGFSL